MALSSSDTQKLISILKTYGNTSSSTTSSSSSKTTSSSSSKTTAPAPTPAPAPAPTPTKSTYDILAPYITPGREEEAKAIISGGGTTTTTPTPTVTPTTTTPLNTYKYVDNTGAIREVSAASATEAMKIAPNIGATSGVQLVQKPTVDVASSTPVREEPVMKEPELLTKPLAAQTYADFKQEIETYFPKAPEVPKLADIYTQERQKLGISALEDEIMDYDAKKAELLSEMDAFKRQENVGQSASFAAGRISAGAQNVQDKIDALERSQAIAINKLNTKNSFLENLIKFTKDDYSTANSNYQFEFNKNLQIQQMFSTKQDKAVDDARATLTTFNNILANSGMSYNDMSTAMRAQINVLEMQAQMPIGTMELYARSKPKSDIVSTQSGTDASGNDFVVFFSKDADGNVTQEKMYTGGVSKTAGGEPKLSETEQKKQDAQTVLAQMRTQAGPDGYVSPDSWRIAKNKWRVIYPDDDFDTRFSILKNPNNQDYD